MIQAIEEFYEIPNAFRIQKTNGTITWLHPALALEFAKWLNSRLAISMTETCVRLSKGDLSLVLDIVQRHKERTGDDVRLTLTTIAQDMKLNKHQVSALHQLNLKNQKHAQMQLTTVNKEHEIEITKITAEYKVCQEKLQTSQQEIHQLATQLLDAKSGESLTTGVSQQELDQFQHQNRIQVAELYQICTETHEHAKTQIAIVKRFGDMNTTRVMRKNKIYKKKIKFNRRKLDEISTQVSNIHTMLRNGGGHSRRKRKRIKLLHQQCE